jgi:hypothetical protein
VQPANDPTINYKQLIQQNGYNAGTEASPESHPLLFAQRIDPENGHS